MVARTCGFPGENVEYIQRPLSKILQEENICETKI